MRFYAFFGLFALEHLGRKRVLEEIKTNDKTYPNINGFLELILRVFGKDLGSKFGSQFGLRRQMWGQDLGANRVYQIWGSI